MLVLTGTGKILLFKWLTYLSSEVKEAGVDQTFSTGLNKYLLLYARKVNP